MREVLIKTNEVNLDNRKDSPLFVLFIVGSYVGFIGLAIATIVILN